MANKYYDPAGKTVTDGDTSSQADINDINTAVEASFDLVESDFTTLSASLINWAALAEEWAENAEDLAVTGHPGQYSALHHSAKANAQRVLAETARTGAETAETNAQTAQTAAELAETNAQTAQSAAELAETNAETAETNAETAETNAAASLATFQGQYHGASATDPVAGLDNGDLYFNTTANEMRVYNGSWVHLYISATAADGSAVLPSGTTAERDVAPAVGYVRSNTTLGILEWYNGSGWEPIGVGATGGIDDYIFYENDTLVEVDYTISSGQNAVSAGPITIDTGVTVTVPTGSVWTVV